MGKTYEVKAGDTLSSIARLVLGNAQRWQELYEANKDVIDDPNVIQPGMVLRIPGEEEAGGQAKSDQKMV
jgi:nucleoid-associated protein YgaU